MRPTALVLVLAAITAAAVAQPLSCPPAAAASGRPCETFHFHVLMFRPDTRTFVELYGINQFASQSACDRARDAQMRRNLAVVDHMKRVVNDQQFEPDRFGTCHCDMTIDRTSSNALTDLQRLAQIRMAEEIRQRVRERLMSSGLPTDSELIRGLSVGAALNPLLGGPKLVPLPQRQAVAATTNAPEDLKSTRAVENNAPAIASLDLPLVEISVALEPPSTSAAVSTMVTTQPAATETATTATTSPATATVPAPSPAAAGADTGGAALARSDDNVPAADETADAFISYETQRIQNVLKASAVINDEGTKSKILESCMQRIQVLSNLRSLIQGSGARSRLATAARNAHSEQERLELVSKLFGGDMTSHWAPRDATDVILIAVPEIDNDAEKVLRDSSGKVADTQKKRALYVFLAHSQPTEDQQLWISTVIDGFLR
jgi:hypothetical protein